jgi:hypothetical protein
MRLTVSRSIHVRRTTCTSGCRSSHAGTKSRRVASPHNSIPLAQSNSRCLGLVRTRAAIQVCYRHWGVCSGSSSCRPTCGGAAAIHRSMPTVRQGLLLPWSPGRAIAWPPRERLLHTLPQLRPKHSPTCRLTRRCSRRGACSRWGLCAAGSEQQHLGVG